MFCLTLLLTCDTGTTSHSQVHYHRHHLSRPYLRRTAVNCKHRAVVTDITCKIPICIFLVHAAFAILLNIHSHSLHHCDRLPLLYLSSGIQVAELRTVRLLEGQLSLISVTPSWSVSGCDRGKLPTKVSRAIAQVNMIQQDAVCIYPVKIIRIAQVGKT